MSARELVGLRAPDLDEAERAELRALLERDPEAAADAALADELSALLAGETLAGGPSIEGLRRPRRSAPWRAVGGAAVLLAAAALVWVVAPGSPVVRDRGVGPAPVAVRLGAVAEGPDGVRPLASGGRVRAGEQVVFWVDASSEGTLRLTEDGAVAVYPPAGSTWDASPGEQTLGGSAPLAWRPDRAGLHRYEVELCDPDARCATHSLALEWLDE